MPPEPFLLDPDLADLMDQVEGWVRRQCPGLPPDAQISRHTLWEISWRVREQLVLFPDRTFLEQGDALVITAYAWWQVDLETGDRVTEQWSRLAAGE